MARINLDGTYNRISYTPQYVDGYQKLPAENTNGSTQQPARKLISKGVYWTAILVSIVLILPISIWQYPFISYSIIINTTQKNSEIVQDNVSAERQETRDIMEFPTQCKDLLGKKLAPEMKILRKGKTICFIGERVAVSNISKEIDSSNQEVSMVTIIAYVFNVDTNITKDFSMAVFATEWILREVTVFNLNGKNGFESGIKRGMLSGNPGSNGNYFLGVGNSDKEKLLVLTNGGNGTDGGNGVDGENAKDEISINCKLKESTLCYLPLGVRRNGPLIQHTFIQFNETSCAKTGTPGGMEGRGGKAGTAYFIDENGLTIQSGKKGVDGHCGRNGTHGNNIVNKICYCRMTKTIKYFEPNKAIYNYEDEQICENKTIHMPLLSSSITVYSTVQIQPKNETILLDSIRLFIHYCMQNEKVTTILTLLNLWDIIEDIIPQHFF